MSFEELLFALQDKFSNLGETGLHKFIDIAQKMEADAAHTKGDGACDSVSLATFSALMAHGTLLRDLGVLKRDRGASIGGRRTRASSSGAQNGTFVSMGGGVGRGGGHGSADAHIEGKVNEVYTDHIIEVLRRRIRSLEHERKLGHIEVEKAERRAEDGEATQRSTLARVREEKERGATLRGQLEDAERQVEKLEEKYVEDLRRQREREGERKWGGGGERIK